MPEIVAIHPDNPQPRYVERVVDIIRRDGVIALPTDSGYAVACLMDNKQGQDTIKDIRQLDDKHNFSLLCHDFSQIGQLVTVNNISFRRIKAATPGPYTFILKGNRELPRRMLHKRKQTVGVRLPDNPLVRAILGELGEPLLCSTLILPGETDPVVDIAPIELDRRIDAIVDAPVEFPQPTTVVDLTGRDAEILRYGAGDPALFE